MPLPFTNLQLVTAIRIDNEWLAIEKGSMVYNGGDSVSCKPIGRAGVVMQMRADAIVAVAEQIDGSESK